MLPWFRRVLCLMMLTPAALLAQEGEGQGWPREAEGSKATVVMYEPQIERLTENDIAARAAVLVKPVGDEADVFGAVWIEARVAIDRDERLVRFDDIRIPRVRFADAEQEHMDELARFLEREMPRWDLSMELDRLIPLLGASEGSEPKEVGLKHDPPKIVVSQEPATLVVLDGAPRKQPMSEPEGAAQAKLERVVNTPVLLVHEPQKKQYFLAGGGDLWYAAEAALGPYAPTSQVPGVVAGLAKPADPEEQDEASEGTPPRVIMATEPTELIVVGEELEYAPLGEVDLLAVSNADRDVIVEMGSRAHYVLLSGRWYVSQKELDGPWSFVAPTELPEAFAQIPEDSDRAHVRAHVPGTIEAQEALLDNTIPQTAAVKRDDKSLKVEYDGEPRFEPVEQAKVEYAVNTAQSVFKLGARYFACEQGVWYESGSPTGPWSVATEVPEAIYDIPASNPHHNVTYVKVYDVTPRVVHVGYTPGYMGSYVYGGCVVYGTGWYYPGWHGRYYYPRPATWGFHATFSPWYGWGFGISWSSGPLTIRIGTGGWGYHSWWGPRGWRPYYPAYRPPYRPGYRPPYYPGYRPPHRPPGHRPPGGRPPGARPPVAGRPLPGTPAQLPGRGQPRANIYQRDGNASRVAPRPSTADRTRPTPATRPNNVYTDRSGGVHRRDRSGGWQQRQGGSWSSPSTRTRDRRSPSSLNRDYGARQRGQARTRQAPRGGRAGGRRR